MSHQFYITLPSDSNMEYYPDNTMVKFTTKSSEAVDLNGDYEVGLTEIIYPHTWYNINNTKGDLWVAIREDTSDHRHVPILKKCAI